MDIKKRRNVAKRIRPVREESSSDNDSDSETNGVVRPGETAQSRKRKRTDQMDGTKDPQRAANSTELEPALVDTPLKPTDSEKQNTAAAQTNGSKPETKVGPVKSQTAIRMTTFTDFAPDVCKDYKKTGFCGFGDSCKFLHAREDYKQGWALDEQWDKAGKDGTRGSGTVVASAGSRAQGIANDAERETAEEEEERKLLEKIPFACTICEKPYTNPIVTKCGHYFCEACALKRYRKSPSCAICGAGTNGVFNGAKKLKELLQKKREREEATKAAESA